MSFIAFQFPKLFLFSLSLLALSYLAGTCDKNLQILFKQIDPPDVVKGLSLVNYYAACGTPVAVEEVLHDAAFTDWKKMKCITV